MHIQHQEVTGTTFRHLFHFYRMSQKKVPWPTDYFGQLAKKLQEIVWRYLGDIPWVVFGWNQPLIWQSILWNASLVQILTSNFEQKTWKRVNFFMGHPVSTQIFHLLTPYILTYCQTPLQLANPTQLQLVWVGVDFVFPRKKEEEEGRRRKE